jgi:hypothetical protein
MNEELDDRLKSRITEVFDNFEDDSAQEGWLLLREKYPEEEKRRLLMWLWWGSAAAILLVALGIGIWLNSNPSITKNKNSVVKNTIKNNTDSVLVNNSHQVQNNNHTNQSKLISHTTQDSHVNLSSKKPQYIAKTADAPKLKGMQFEVSSNKESGNNNQLQGNKPVANQTGIDVALINKDRSSSNPKETTITGINITKQPDSSATNYAAQKPVPGKVMIPMAKNPDKNLLAFLKADESKTQKPTVDKRVKFGVYAATYFNYAKGSDNEFNLGAGISSEIKLAGRLRLLTGIAIAQNSLNYSSVIPQAANNYLAASIAAQSTHLFAVANPTNPVMTTSTISPVLKNYQASLIGLDIPVNLKYQFSKTDTYVSAGVSSGTYINETYQYLFTYNTTVKTQDNNDKTESSFSTFDFAKTLNLSFGMGYPLGKSNRLIIEPFLKYPLNGLGAQQIRFGASGVNLKFNFQSH